jgi:hypothetical protein
MARHGLSTGQLLMVGKQAGVVPPVLYFVIRLIQSLFKLAK